MGGAWDLGGKAGNRAVSLGVAGSGLVPVGVAGCGGKVGSVGREARGLDSVGVADSGKISMGLMGVASPDGKRRGLGPTIDVAKVGVATSTLDGVGTVDAPPPPTALVFFTNIL